MCRPRRRERRESSSPRSGILRDLALGKEHVALGASTACRRRDAGRSRAPWRDLLERHRHGRLEPATMQPSGASKPRNLRAFCLRNSAKSPGVPRASSIFSFRFAHLPERLAFGQKPCGRRRWRLARIVPSATNLVDRAHRGGLRGRHVLSRGDSLERGGHAHDAGQALRAARARQDAELDLGQTGPSRTARRRGNGSRARLQGRRPKPSRGSRPTTRLCAKASTHADHLAQSDAPGRLAGIPRCRRPRRRSGRRNGARSP